MEPKHIQYFLLSRNLRQALNFFRTGRFLNVRDHRKQSSHSSRKESLLFDQQSFLTIWEDFHHPRIVYFWLVKLMNFIQKLEFRWSKIMSTFKIKRKPLQGIYKKIDIITLEISRDIKEWKSFDMHCTAK